MEKFSLQKEGTLSNVQIHLPTSKSESNRLLIMQALSANAFHIDKLSTAEDTLLLQKALSSSAERIDVGMAGTAFRFLTAYYACQAGRKTLLTGAERMKKRPIALLVNALRELGAEIRYLEEEGYPPLAIQGKVLKGGKLTMDGSVSSQFISALLLIAPTLRSPLTLELNELVSKPYVDLTIALMNKLNAKLVREGNILKVDLAKYHTDQAIEVEADWSSAAFFYQLVAFEPSLSLELMGLNKNSHQGDKRLAELYKTFGVHTSFKKASIILTSTNQSQPTFQADLSDCPDLIPSVAVTAAVLSKKAVIKGVQTLRIKESNRIEALKRELKKMGVELTEIDDHSIELHPKEAVNAKQKLSFLTYNDHRMAMCLAPLVFCFDEVEIENPLVVNKSFTGFWEELKRCGVRIE